MSTTATLVKDEVDFVHDAPKLLVEWSSPWQEFLTAIKPALGRSERRLAGEARTGLVPLRNMLASWLAEVLVLILLAVIPARLERMKPYVAPQTPKYDVIYYTGDELPQVEDQGGAQAGAAGRSGGQEARHHSQAIRVSRGSTVRERVVDAPDLKLPRSESAVANLLAYKAIPGPPPAEGLRSSRNTLIAPQMAAIAPVPEVPRDRMRAAPTLSSAAIAPAPDLEQQRLRAAPALSAAVVGPPPEAPRRDALQLPVPGMHAVQVVPPPISAPVQSSTRQAKMTLPAQTPIAPAPTNITRDFATSGPGFGPDLHRQVVPPPVQVGTGMALRQGVARPGQTAVIPPPVQMSGGNLSHQTHAGFGGGSSVIAPPPTVSDASLGGSGRGSRSASLAGGASAVAPAPSVSGGSLGGTGRGNRGIGLGGPMDIGSVAAPPKNGGTSGGKGVIVSSQPGTTLGTPGNGGAGSLAMSPSGGAKPGVGGSGGGTSIGHGAGPGSGFNGEGTGAGHSGAGPGSDPSARSGISPYPGSGGTGSGTIGTPPVPGVSVRGGSNIVTLPSFGSEGDAPGQPGRSSLRGKREGPDITIVATSRSGGAFNFYGALKGDRVYTIYIDTPAGPAVMQYADPVSAEHPYAETLVAPQPLHAALPSGLPRARLVIACVLDRSGLLRHPQVLESAPALMTSKVLAALNSWKFKPAMRGTEPVEVNAILGFNIDTNDRY